MTSFHTARVYGSIYRPKCIWFVLIDVVSPLTVRCRFSPLVKVTRDAGLRLADAISTVSAEKQKANHFVTV